MCCPFPNKGKFFQRACTRICTDIRKYVTGVGHYVPPPGGNRVKRGIYGLAFTMGKCFLTANSATVGWILMILVGRPPWNFGPFLSKKASAFLSKLFSFEHINMKLSGINQHCKNPPKFFFFRFFCQKADLTSGKYMPHPQYRIKKSFLFSELQELEVRICVQPNFPIIILILLNGFKKFQRSRGLNSGVMCIPPQLGQCNL